ncbi:MAG TPA: tetratricopeptide repeat protein [Bryobacteraceae bacterium]|nr:tetratricopeptide repeat protein [Bryobacteraceae bacterium]
MWGRVPILVIVAAASLAAQEQADSVDQVAAQPDALTTLTVSGSVQLASANRQDVLPSDIQLAVDCKGQSVDGGSVSPSGKFHFSMNPDPLAIEGATICTVEAKVFGYDSTVAKFSVRSSTGVVNAGTIMLTRNSAGNVRSGDRGAAGATVSATSLRAPPAAVKQFEQGKQSLRQKKSDKAAASFEAAIRIYPEYADAWMNLGLMAVQQSDLLTAARDLDEALRVDSGVSFQACYADALVNLMLKRYDVAEKAARAALRHGDGGTNARVNFVLGMALLARGANVEARGRLMRYLELAPEAPEREQIQREFDRLDRLAGE